MSPTAKQLAHAHKVADRGVKDGRRSAKLGREIEWWYVTAVRHSAADAACDRPWSCMCGPCREGRSILKVSTHYGVLNYGAARIVAYQIAMQTTGRE
jgi:hypothetical protein